MCERGLAVYDPFGPVRRLTSTPRVGLGVRCTAPAGACANGASLHAAWSSLYSARVRISDQLLPSVSQVGGALWSDAFHHGIETATVSATDNVGIRGARLLADDVLRASAARGCDYTSVVPCSNEPGANLTVDTHVLSDGPHQLSAVVEDAAGNAASATRTIITDNTAPTAPVGLAREQNGSSGITVQWTTPTGQVAPIVAAHWSFCPPDATQGCATGSHAQAGIERLTDLTAPGSGSWDLRVWLEDAAGNADSRTAGPPLRVTSPGALRSPGLRIRSVQRRGRLLSISGVSIANRGRVAVTIQRRAGTHLSRVRGVTRVRSGRWTRRLRMTPRLSRYSRVTIVARIDAQAGFRAATARRTFRR